jgi:hypothetical protein
LKYDHIFVLSPGRSGSKTFAEACKYLTNYTAAHESRGGKIGEERFNFPTSHIEADNRLTWFLGSMAERFDDKNVLYVHLSRDFNQTVDSFVHRLRNSDYRSSIIRAFAHGILMKPGDWTPEEEVELCRLYVQTIHSNINEFVKNRQHQLVQLGDSGTSFNSFIDSISPEGDIDRVKSTWLEVHNAR